MKRRCFSPVRPLTFLSRSPEGTESSMRETSIFAQLSRKSNFTSSVCLTRDRNKMAKSFLLYDMSLWFIFLKERRKVEFGVSNDC